MILRELGAEDTAVARSVVKRFRCADVSEAYLETLLADPANVLVVADSEGRIAGFVWAHWLGRLRLEQRHLFVYEIEVGRQYRRRGVGTRLMQHVLERSASGGSDLFVMTNRSNEAAVAFFTALGGIVKNGDDLLIAYPADRAT